MKHPARFSQPVLKVLAETLTDLDCHAVVDPFAGVGGLVDIRKYGWSGLIDYIEIEPEWANAIPADTFDLVWIGDMLEVLPTIAAVRCVATSPVYGNRMSDHHEARDHSVRRSYRHDLGRPLTAGNSGSLQWGDAYQNFHIKAWRTVFNSLYYGGYFLLNVSNHIRKGKEVPVVGWHRWACEILGFEFIGERLISTPRLRYGQNHAARVEGEYVLIFRKPS